MKKLMLLAVAAAVAGVICAAPSSKKSGRGKSAPAPQAAEEDATSAIDAKIVIDQFPKTGRASTLPAPKIDGASLIGTCYNKPRRWIVLEAKYSTFAKFQDQLTFTWHVLLETKSATENKGNREHLAPYSYFTTAVTYYNIPQGAHAASVCLPPSYLERFGEPKAIGVVISNAKGETLYADAESEIKGIAHHPKSVEQLFWNNQDIMNAQEGGEPMIERRQGLVDRSKTIWALVNPNDYETTQQ